MIWNDRGQFILASLFGVLLWIVNLAQAHVLGPVSVALPALVAGFTTPFVLATSWLVTRKTGSITATYVSFAAMATFNLVMGPPGLHKILLALLAGLAFDLTVVALRHALPQRTPLYAGFTAYTVVSMLSYVGAFVLLDLPGKDKLIATIYVFAAVFYVEGLISITLAGVFYRRWLLTIPSIRDWSESGTPTTQRSTGS